VELVQEIVRWTISISDDVMKSTFFVPAAVRGTTEAECGLIPKYVHNQVGPLQHVASCYQGRTQDRADWAKAPPPEIYFFTYSNL